MRCSITIFLGVLTLTFFSLAQEANDRIDNLQLRNQQALDLAAEPIAKFDARYVEELGKLKATVQSRGDLNSALLIDSEIKEHLKKKERDFGNIPELFRLRKIYEEARSRLEKEVLSKKLSIHQQSLQKFDELSKGLTMDGDLAGALKCKEIKQSIVKAIETAVVLSSSNRESRFKAKVSATNFVGDPINTGVALVKGQAFSIVPNPKDKWTGGGSKRGVYCNYQGYPGNGGEWMQMRYQIGENKAVPVVSDAIQTAPSNGELKLFAEDGSAAGNAGDIRVEIIVNPNQSG